MNNNCNIFKELGKSRYVPVKFINIAYKAIT